MAQAASITLYIYQYLENMYLKPVALSITVVLTLEVRVFVSFAVARVAAQYFDAFSALLLLDGVIPMFDGYTCPCPTIKAFL